MAQTRNVTLKVKEQCRVCGEYDGMKCKKGLKCLCFRNSKRKCAKYRKPSVIEAAKELSAVAGVDWGESGGRDAEK